jgi:4-hydroxythreonine-4-phosphate dehydrogenase
LSRPDEKRSTKRPILVSQGEPSGIGPEVAVKAWAQLGGAVRGHPIRLIGNADVFLKAAAFSKIDAGGLGPAILDLASAVRTEPGRPSSENVESVTSAIARAVEACLNGEAAAMVTAPIHKSVLTSAGFEYPGHTEYIAALTRAERAVMMLASSGIEPLLRVVPFTIHIALAEIFRHLDARAIAATGKVVLDSLKRDFGCGAPRLAIAGLNPHAGEDGTMGREELDIIAPAADQLRASGYDADGPLPADTLFHDEARKTYDAALCMYHDQALIPIKTLAFWTGVNVTLGLPIVRTSPDHGTALTIAGRGVANPASMIAALDMAAEIADRRGL